MGKYTYPRVAVVKRTLSSLAYWSFLSWLLTLSLIDLDTMTLPNSLTQSGLVVGILFQGIIAFFQTAQLSTISAQLMTGIGGAVLGIWLFDTITLVGSFMFGQTAMG